MALAMAVTLFSTTALAAGSSRTTQVVYDSSSETPDPDNPTNPQWAVQVPTAIVFTDEAGGRDANANVTLLKKGGATDFPTDKIKVEVASKNGYKLQLNGTAGVDDLVYSLDYEDTQMPQTKGSVDNGTAKTLLGHVNKSHEVITSTAHLRQDAMVTGTHTDTLTYTITKETTTL